jgi:hypothetical protein
MVRSIPVCDAILRLKSRDTCQWRAKIANNSEMIQDGDEVSTDHELIEGRCRALN